ncbi:MULTISPECIES: glycerophosphodiester phosphodiesterase family protein [unclassified Roseitalea]|uniref:glycerophosphodiester phosphodiesterase family protein n=1 Tax=unclassified Roseitalea TaxID=2639107 RepID=UPI00273E6EB4|nr:MULTISPECIES: glycerophosphodiester phosphodiesterase family protein [unclassified Roseitalea]
MSLSFLTARPIAHRGLHDGNRRRWENTLAAFEAAIAGRFAIELDVQLSADGIAMVFHDDRMDRLTDESGPVAAYSAAHLGDTRVGGTAATIPTLAQVLDHVAGRVPVIIEMKDNDARNAQLAVAVATDLDGYDGAAAVMSFSRPLLGHFARTRSQVPFGLTAAGTGPTALALHERAFALGISFVSYHVRDLPNAFVAKARRRALPVITWTVRTRDELALSRRHADQITFEGFDPDANASLATN